MEGKTTIGGSGKKRGPGLNLKSDMKVTVGKSKPKKAARKKV